MSPIGKSIAVILALAIGVTSPQLPAQQIDLAAGRWVDLSHEYASDTIYWPTAEGFSKETVFEGMTEGGWWYTAYNIATAEHGGTHIDAPIHFAEGRQTVDQIPLYRLIAPAVVIDVSDSAVKNPDYLISESDITAWEGVNDRIPPGTIVLFNTGFAERWPDPQAYMGTDARGPEAVSQLHFPGIDPAAASFLVRQRSIASVGLDTPSIDYGQSQDFMTHRILFEHDIPGFENLTNLDQLPATGAILFALPMKIKGGSGGPLRAVAFVPQE